MRKKKVKPATVVSYVILTIFALIVLVPFIWFVSTSFDYVKSYSLRFPPLRNSVHLTTKWHFPTCRCSVI